MFKQRRRIFSFLACAVLLPLIPITNSSAFSIQEAAARSNSTSLSSNTAAAETRIPSVAEPLFTQEWQVLISKIDQARDRGELTIDAAARLRFTALTTPDILPVEFQLTLEEQESILDDPADEGLDGEGVLGPR